MAEDKKTRAYPLLDVTPAAFEIYGRVGESLQALCGRILFGYDEENATPAWMDIRQSLSAALQYHNTEMVLRASAADWVRSRRAPTTPAAAAAPATPADAPAAPADPAAAPAAAAA